MADKRRGKNKRSQNEPIKPSKEEYSVAKYLRFNLPSKEAKLVRMPVQCFIASKAVDLLMQSKWSSAKGCKTPLFTTRQSCEAYCDRLLNFGIFHRAAKEERKKKDDKAKTKKVKDSEVKEEKSSKDKKSKQSPKPDKSKKDKKENPEEVKSNETVKSSETVKGNETVKETTKDEEKAKKKKERKLKLKMHDSQVFIDGEEIYVWIYDPVPVKTFVIGLFLVLGAIGVCLFPLWPPEVRLGVYYLSLCAAGFLGVILSLCIIRLILFCCIWCLTLGRHHFWFLPNLTEDVGFFDSFKPLYKHHSNVSNTKDESDKKKGTATDEGKGKDETKENEPLEGDGLEEDGPEAEDSEGDEQQEVDDEGFDMIELEEIVDDEKSEDENAEEDEHADEHSNPDENEDLTEQTEDKKNV